MQKDLRQLFTHGLISAKAVDSIGRTLYSCSSQVMNLGGVIALAVLAAQILEDQEAVPKPPTREEIERRLKFGFGL